VQRACGVSDNWKDALCWLVMLAAIAVVAYDTRSKK